MKKMIVLMLMLMISLYAVSGSAVTFMDAHGNTVELDETLSAYADFDMLGGANAREGETNLGDFWTDALRWFAASGLLNASFEEDDVKAGLTLEADEAHIVALWNAGNLREDLASGVFTAEQIAQVLPYPNKVAVVYMTGEQLQRQLEACAQGLPVSDESMDACAAFMQVSGIEYTVDLTRPYEAGEPYGDHWRKAEKISRVSVTSVNGQPFEPDAVYAVITSNANFNGMDVSYVMKEAAEADERSTITTAVVRDVIWQYLTDVLSNRIGSEYEKPQGRIQIVK
ncbi:MAG: 5'-nucleotidase C-terminal domain-containing protein [Clostridia bacterium]|nr:5'-nucleotidase C-terminal domain-containing protein [Clostridia bacterium]